MVSPPRCARALHPLIARCRALCRRRRPPPLAGPAAALREKRCLSAAGSCLCGICCAGRRCAPPPARAPLRGGPNPPTHPRASHVLPPQASPSAGGDGDLRFETTLAAKCGLDELSLRASLPGGEPMQAALRRLLPALKSTGSYDLVLALLGARAGGDGAAAPAGSGVAVASKESGVPPGATYVFRGGRLHPLFREPGGGDYCILTPGGKVPVTGSMPGFGTRFVSLPPAGSVDDRLKQLRDKGAAVESVTIVDDLADLDGSKRAVDYTLSGAGHYAYQHVILPNGLMLPVWWDNGRAWVRHPNLRRVLGLKGDEDANSFYWLKDLRGTGKCAHVHLA